MRDYFQHFSEIVLLLVGNLIISISVFFLFSHFCQRNVCCDEIHGNDAIQDTWEDVHMICPNQCVCMHSPFMDLSIARWIQHVKHAAQESSPDNENEVFNARCCDAETTVPLPK